MAQSIEGGGLHLTAPACLPRRPAKLRWLQCRVPNLSSLRLVWDWIKRPVNGGFLCWSSMGLSRLFRCYFLCRGSATYKNSVFQRSHKKKYQIFALLSTSLLFPSLFLRVCLYISLHVPSSYFVNHNFFLAIWELYLPSPHPSYFFWLAVTLTLSIFLSSFFLLLRCHESSLWNGNEVSLALSLPPSLSRHQNEAMPPMFFSDLGVPPNLISGAGREREGWRKRWSRLQRKERGHRTKRWKERGWKMNKGKKQRERWGQSRELIQEHLSFFSYYSRAQHNPSFFCWATTPCFWLRISW